jgi:hypothetical protein
MTGFRNPVVGGQGALIRESIHSPNFIAGVQGWTINKDGSSEFSDSVVRGTVEVGPLAGSHIILDPDVEVGFNDGFLQAVVRMFPDVDPNMMMEAMLGVVTFATGQADAQMASVLHSPTSTTGFGIVLTADADDGSVTANAALGSIVVDGDAMTFTPVFLVEIYGATAPAFLSYGTGGVPGQVVRNFMSSTTWQAPPGVTSVLAECWGGGGSGANPVGAPGGGGGGGGEYAAQTVVVTPGNNYVVTVGTSAAPSTFPGDAVTVTGHGGSSTASGTGGAGGTGSTNTVHHNGGNGASTVFTGGGGGGGAAGTTAVGNLAQPGHSDGTGGAGGAGGLSGGGKGGKGGNNNGAAGVIGNAPGGGGDGAGGGSSPDRGLGAVGQVRLTYTATGIPPIVASMAGAAGTDKFGTAFPAGFVLEGKSIPMGNLVLNQSNGANAAVATGAENKDVMGDSTFTAVAGRKYRFSYSARMNAAGAIQAGDLRIRGNNSAVSPNAASTQLAGASTGTLQVGGAGAAECEAKQTRLCPSQLAAGLWTVAPFFAGTAGGGTIVANQAGGQLREFSVDEV